MKNNTDAMNIKDNRRPTSLLIPKTSPLAKTKFLFAITEIIIPETIAPAIPAIPTKLPNKKAMTATITVEAK